MADLHQHMETCQRFLGQNLREVHVYLDQFLPIFGIRHRALLHHQRGVELIVHRFDESARAAAELHIIEDLAPYCLRLPGYDWRRLQIPGNWEAYGKPLFLDLDLGDRFDQELLNLYCEKRETSNT